MPPKLPTIKAPQGAYSSHPPHRATIPVRTPFNVRRKLHFPLPSLSQRPLEMYLNENKTVNPPPHPPMIVLTTAAPTAATSPLPDILSYVEIKF